MYSVTGKIRHNSFKHWQNIEFGGFAKYRHYAILIITIINKKMNDICFALPSNSSSYSHISGNFQVSFAALRGNL